MTTNKAAFLAVSGLLFLAPTLNAQRAATAQKASAQQTASKAPASNQIKLEHFKNWKPRNIGPAGMSGRVTSIDAVWTNPDIIYLATASGGVWKTENAGGNWTPLFDE
ncbi:MAG: hypothetical protein H7Y27_14900, partial [Gemmatimonadaceae bacterium]|nr:hypothetical protein [Chitinophagaceae bacterium]